MFKKMATVLSVVVLAATASITAQAGVWKQDNVGWWWQNDDGSYPVSKWEWLDGNNDGVAESYCFDARGYMYADTVTPDNYTVNKDGQWTVNGVVQTKQIEISGDRSVKPSDYGISESQAQKAMAIYKEEADKGQYAMSIGLLMSRGLSEMESRYVFDSVFNGREFLLQLFKNTDSARSTIREWVGRPWWSSSVTYFTSAYSEHLYTSDDIEYVIENCGADWVANAETEIFRKVPYYISWFTGERMNDNEEGLQTYAELYDYIVNQRQFTEEEYNEALQRFLQREESKYYGRWQ